MKVYQIPQDVLDREYNGRGRGWAAIKDGQVVAIRYDEYVTDEDDEINEFGELAELATEDEYIAKTELAAFGEVVAGTYRACEFCAD